MELRAGPTPSVAAMLDRLDPAMAAATFAPAARQRLRALADRLPPARFLLFEQHLNAPAPRTDLSIGLAASTPAGFAAPAWLAHPAPILFEYDLVDEPVLAGIFATFLPLMPADEAQLARLAEALLGPLASPTQRALAHAVARQVPGESWITHFGVMTGRPAAPLRINIGGRSVDSLRRHLSGLDPGLARTLDRLLDLFGEAGGTRIAALDIGERFQPRLGLECYFPGGQEQWPSLLAHLHDIGLCTAGEAEGIVRWPLEADEAEPEWPEPFRSLDRLVGPEGQGRLVRSINHLKLTADADATVTAKAYLAAHYLRGDGVAARGLAA